jgi:biotin synthase
VIQLSKDYIINALNSDKKQYLQEILQAAGDCLRKNVGNKVYLRGLIEFSNYCDRNCLYCGLRKNNRSLNRYHLNKDEIVQTAMLAFDCGYHSICLQSGETDNSLDVDFLFGVVEEIKRLSIEKDKESRGLGITLCVGELDYHQYKRLWEAGAHRYLLRIESSDPELFKRIHPPSQKLETRINCLRALKDIGYQTGTGVMIGLPGQTSEQLYSDLMFFQDMDVDMLGMGPYIPHNAAPLSKIKEGQMDPYITTLKMLAFSRLLMPDINIVASTALQCINHEGLRMGLEAGANIVMPTLTPENVREDYHLYENKKYKKKDLLLEEIIRCNRTPGLWQWGDPLHYEKSCILPDAGNQYLAENELRE